MTTPTSTDSPSPQPTDAPRDAERDDETRRLLEAAHCCVDAQERLHFLDQVVLLNLDVARRLASRYFRRGVATEDLIQVANFALVKAARAYDPDKGDNFLSYAAPTILGELKRHFRDQAWTVKPPRRVQEMQMRLMAASSDLAQQHGGVQSTGQLARHLDAAESEVAEAMGLQGCFTPASLDRPVGDLDAAGYTLVDTIAIEERGFVDAEDRLALDSLLSSLSARDRRIVYLRFYREWTQVEIARELGVTQMQISRILSRILRHLRTKLDVSEAPMEPRARAS